MPHFICSSCKTGLYSAARPANLIDARCPTCGAATGEARPPGHLGGVRSTSRSRSGPTRVASADHRRIAERFGAFMGRAHSARARLDATQTSIDTERWLDDGGSLKAGDTQPNPVH